MTLILRIVEKQVNDCWEPTAMSGLKCGDKFRMFEPDTKEPVVHKNHTVFIATSDPYCTDGVWGIIGDEC